jgi:hypothetical protein
MEASAAGDGVSGCYSTTPDACWPIANVHRPASTAVAMIDCIFIEAFPFDWMKL